LIPFAVQPLHTVNSSCKETGMSNIARVCAALLVLLVSFQAVAGERARIVVLGTFHFEGSDTDGISVTMDDIMSPRRQEDVREVVDRLAAFRPTRILVEVPHERQARLDTDYRSYLDGERELGPGEVDQLGMRLARRLRLEGLHAIDAKQDMDFLRMMKAGGAAGQDDLLAWFQRTMGEVQSGLAQAQSSEQTLLDALRFHNGPWALGANGLYIKLAELGTSDDPAGAEVIGGWYQRNLKIFANIARAVRGPDERVLVIVGSGHLAQLSDFVDQHPDFELVPALQVLDAP
jgi:hypothetical protein